MRILLTEAGTLALHDPYAGPELFQSLLKRLQASLMGNMLEVTAVDWDLLKRYAEGADDDAVRTRAEAIIMGAVPG